jgi:sigma-B regulation protein RsbU (phosphoserine phosphatase)
MVERGWRNSWRNLGRWEKAFGVSLLAYVALRLVGHAPVAQFFFACITILLGLVVAFRLSVRGLRKAIWRLRNRLMAAYVFIAVVPVVLILALAVITGYMVIGQIAVYLVNTELEHREWMLMRSAEVLARSPITDAATALSRFETVIHGSFPDFALRVSGRRELRYPLDVVISRPPAEWKSASGLIVKPEREDGAGGKDRLYAWAHVVENGEEVTVIAPLTIEALGGLMPGLGDVTFLPAPDLPDQRPVIPAGRAHTSRIPPASNWLDFALQGSSPVTVSHWRSPGEGRKLVLSVHTRASAVLGTIFKSRNQSFDWAEFLLIAFVVITILFLLVELISLVAGVQLSRSITGAVHELYTGTRRVRQGDFAYRIPVKGNDQLAEMATSFNTMTANLGQLMVVAKEKERLESELTIAREVQRQLFPKDVPYTRTLELKGVCSPARMVSGDYYDFVKLGEGSLAFAIGDVAGKGISAALLMATIQSTMRTQLGASNGSPAHGLSTAKLVATLNRQLYANTSLEKYATFYFALYHEDTHSLTYTNAGHLSPMLLRAGEMQMLESTGTVVGAFPLAHYDERTVELEHGDLLVAYTDGIVEPENAYGEMFGEDRLTDLVSRYADADSSELIARTMEAVNVWTGGGELQDDMTMVVARRI